MPWTPLDSSAHTRLWEHLNALAAAVTPSVQTYTPALTGFPAATASGTWQQVGGWVTASVVVTTSAAGGSGVWMVSLPVAANADVADRLIGSATTGGTGAMQLFTAQIVGSDGTKCRCLARPSTAGPGDPIGALWAMPSWTKLLLNLSYPAA